ncbi:MAG: hypothetical protein GWN87_10520, partial [Desulfuromonadales bacterium]|nr:hypothetical protein [Desulfuromonadales bacterium]NIS40892.1 hypothetical protein [Desulfuromonadales bacterium]
MTAEKEAAAVIRYDRVERTVTIKSRKISLSRIIKTIDTVSPSPINLYLQNEQYIPINLENTHWYRALRYVVENADLKQVNLDGKIDLYTRLFYYKHVSPYLKVAGNVGVYMNAGSGGDSKELTRDDGTTRYVFINDFENSAEVAQQYRAAKAKNESSGFIQIHEGSGPAPVSDYGTFARSGESSAQPQAAAVEAVEEQVPAEPVEEVPEPAVEESKPARAPLKPYSGEKVAAEQEEPVVVAAAPPEEPADPAPEAKQEEPDQQVPEEPVAETEAEKTPAKTEVEEPAADQQEPASDRGEEAAQADREQGSREQTGGTQTGSAEKTDAGAPVAAAQLEFSLAHAVAILLIIVVVIIGCVYLTRSAGAKAAEAEKHVEPDDLDQQDELDIDTGVQVDKKYEEEIFDQLDHVSDPAPDKEEASAERPQESSRQETVNEETKSAEESGQTEEAYHPRDVAGSEKRIHTGPELEDVAD